MGRCRSNELVTPDDDLIGIPGQRIADSGLIGKTVEVIDQVLQVSGIRQQADDFHRRRRLLRRADVRTHQAFEDDERLFATSQFVINLTKQRAGFRPEFRVHRSDLERLDRTLLFFRRPLQHRRATDAEVAAAGILALWKTLQTLGKCRLRFGRALAKQVPEADVEIQQLQRRVLVRAECHEQLLDLRDRPEIFLGGEGRLRLAEKPVQSGRSYRRRGRGRWCLGLDLRSGKKS